MFKGYNVGFNVSTPNISISEGLRPAQHYVAAAYLPTVRYDNVYMDYKVISNGKVVAIDSGNFLVPAGLTKDIELAISTDAAADGSEWNDTTIYGNRYSQTDIDLGIKNSLGNIPVVGEPVVKSFFTGGTVNGGLLRFVSAPIGLAPQDIWKQNGAGYGPGYSAGNPVDYTFTNYNLQQGSTVWTAGFIELPIIAQNAQTTLPGMVTFEGALDLQKSLVTFNSKSNFVSVGNTFAQKDVIGRILFVDDQWPKSFLEYVKVWEPNSTLGTPATPGSATLGLPDNLFLAGLIDPNTAKAVRINFSIH